MSFLTILMNFLFAGIFISAAYALFPEVEVKPLALILMAIFPYGLYFVRLKVRKPLAFVAAHLALPALWVMGLKVIGINWQEWVCFALILVIYVAVSLGVRKKNDDASESPIPPVGAGIAALGLTLLCAHYGDGARSLFIMYCFVGFLSLYFIVYYLDRYTMFVKLNRIGETKLQERKIYGVGVKMATGYTIFAALVLMVSTGTTFMNDVMAYIGNAIKRFLIFIISLLPKEEVYETAEEVTEEVAAEQPMMPQMPTDDNSLLAIFWRALETVVTIAMFVAFLAALWIVAKMIVKAIRKMLSREITRPLEYNDINVREHTESLKQTRKSRKDRPKLFDLSNNARIRRTYAKLIAKRRIIIEKKTGSALEYLSARQCLDAIFDSEISDKFATIYEAARYGLKSCSAEDVAAVNGFAASMRK
ncbi:hypothetical protein SAMN02910368_02710 [Lachnospiraceae bacterium G11]|nr:hypothetical protein SAMN02910368_02710 [Lachnospiraceae bacterium G11]